MQLQRRLPTPGFLSFLQNIAKSGDIALDGAWVRLSKHSVRLTDADERLWAKMAPLLGGQSVFARRACATWPACSALAKATCDGC